MPAFITVQDTTFAGRHRSFYSYVNQESTVHTGSCCGQAAVVSAYATVQNQEWHGGLTDFVRGSPPDNFFGALGSSAGRIQQMLRNMQFSGADGNGRPNLRRVLRDRPAIVCLDVNKIDSSKMGLHWVTVFGYGDDYYYVSNWRGWRIRRRRFREAWSAPLVFVLGLSERYFKV